METKCSSINPIRRDFTGSYRCAQGAPEKTSTIFERKKKWKRKKQKQQWW
jgi:hypothetical protein